MKITYLSLHRALDVAFDQEIFMAIKYKKTENHTAGQQIKFTGSGGSMAAGTAPLAGGGGGGGAEAVSWTRPAMFGGGTETTAVNANDTVTFLSTSAAFNSLTSTYASQAYTISTSDASYNAVSQIASGNVPLNLGDINFAASYGSTYSTVMGPATGYYFIATVSGVTFKISVGVLSGGGGGGVPIGGGGGGVFPGGGGV